MLGWVPTSGDQPIGVCLFTYNGTVNVGVATDTRMIPDPSGSPPTHPTQ
jgi:diacylglycerol O-acyltransferase